MAPRDGPWPQRKRDLSGAWQAIEDLRYAIDHMDRTAEIAEKVSAQMKRDTVLGLSVVQKAFAGLAGAVVMAAAICSLLGVHL